MNANAYKLCFWFIAYLLYDDELLDAIRAETRPAMRDDRPTPKDGGDTTNTASTASSASSSSFSVDLDYLLERCPLLASVFEEILRLANAPIGTRTVMQRDIELSSGRRYQLPPGSKLLMPYRQMHFSAAAFGADAARFNARRFLRDPGLARSPSFRPFGGAATYCPGRFLARREVYVFVVLLLHRFELRLTGGDTPAETAGAGGEAAKPRFPRLDEQKPTGGMMGPVEGDDVIMLVTKKANDVV